ncbi:flagellar filament capping protein FliD [Salinicola halophilus]|uniref:flagellar filament capping protein FliD n=1 Tax=Salinicola halophilus TaxID=184065 RepID=UPI000DA1F7AC|nr:flagellar filament capping protein FliD [Salinicola halophilus]
MASISSLGIGSGLDLNGLLGDLEKAEKEKLTPIVNQQKSYNTKLSAFGKLESSLESLRDSLTKLDDAETFTAVKSSVTGDAISATTTGDAVEGRYDIQVSQLAQAQSLASRGHASQSEALEASDNSELAGQLSFTVGKGEDASTFSIDVIAGGSLEDLRDAINGANKGVSASIINDGSGTPYRLALTSKKMGEDHQIAIRGDNDNLNAAFSYDPAKSSDTNGMAEKVPARNALLKVNGVDIVSQSNTVEGALQGTTLELTATTESATLSVSKDTESMTKAVNAFVTAYNSFQTMADSLTSYDAESDTAGVLLGNSTMRSIESRLRSALSAGTGTDVMSRLSDLGIERQLDGKLKVDDDKLSEAITSDSDAISRFFGGSDGADGFADSFNVTLNSILDEGGLLETSTSGIDTSLKRLDDRYNRTQETINSTIDRYRKQFSQLDSLVAQMNSTSSYLTQQFDSLNAQLNQ